MNEHEIERIADAMHRLRPDWPVKQVRTLLGTPQLADRPRRDVCVALAWVACENGTATPYRVLEAGPWWRAAAIEGSAQRREVLSPSERCSICSQSRAVCENRPRFGFGDDHDDHTFTPDFKQPAGSAVDELRDIKAAAMTKTDCHDGGEEENDG